MRRVGFQGADAGLRSHLGGAMDQYAHILYKMAKTSNESIGKDGYANFLGVVQILERHQKGAVHLNLP